MYVIILEIWSGVKFGTFCEVAAFVFAARTKKHSHAIRPEPI